jgi:hypothetical protein
VCSSSSIFSKTLLASGVLAAVASAGGASRAGAGALAAPLPKPMALVAIGDLTAGAAGGTTLFTSGLFATGLLASGFAAALGAKRLGIEVLAEGVPLISDVSS